MLTPFEYGYSGFWPARGLFYYFFTLKFAFKLVRKSAPEFNTNVVDS
jgi:hypothetical protein